MPRVIPKRARRPDGPDPAPPLPPPGIYGLVVTRSFSCEGVSFLKGAVVSVNNELVQRIYAERPDLLKPAGR
jgi:hypothetical protein